MPRKSTAKSDSNGNSADVDVQPTPDQAAPIDFVDGTQTPDTTATDKVQGDPNWSVFDETDKTGKPDVIGDMPDYTDGQYSGWADVSQYVDDSTLLRDRNKGSGSVIDKINLDFLRGSAGISKDQDIVGLRKTKTTITDKNTDDQIEIDHRVDQWLQPIRLNPDLARKHRRGKV